MPSEKYIEKRIQETRGAPATSFYTEQRKTEYKTVPEALQAQYSGMVASYKREAFKHALPPELQGVTSKAEFVEKKAGELVKSGVPPRIAYSWAAEYVKQWDKFEAEVGRYAEQKVRSETQTALVTGAAIGGIVAAPSVPAAIGLKGYSAAALSGAVSGVSGAQTFAGIFQGRIITPQEALVSAGVGAAVGVGTQALFQKVITPKASQWLTQRYIEKGPLEWKGLPEKLVMKLTGAKPYLASGTVNIPTPEKVNLKGLEAQLAGWELTETPRSSGLLISKMPSDVLAKTWVKEHIYAWTTGGLSYSLVHKQLKTVPPKIEPYIPINISTPAEDLVRVSVLTGALAGTIVPSPRQREPLFKASIPQPPKVLTREKPKVEVSPFQQPKTFEIESEELKKTVKIAPASITVSKTEIEQVAKQEPQAIQKIKLENLTPQSLLPNIKQSDILPKPPQGRRTRKGLDLFGWYRWDYPILSPEKLLRGFNIGLGSGRIGRRSFRRRRR